MANKAKKKGFSVQGFDAAAWRNTEEFAKAVDRIYMSAVDDFSRLASRLSIDPIKPFSFNDYPTAKREAQKIVSGVSENIKSVVVTGTEKQWLFACAKNDAFLNHIINTSKVPKKTLAKYQDRNLDALDSFQNRKVNGLDLSNRIWNYTDQFKAQMELGIDIGIGDGKSAQALSRDLRQYLVDPDKLFRRVRDKHGNLVLSKAAKAFSPGQGKYRSSYKNAVRLTRTEINMAYRESDYLRWNQLDFVVGYEVKLSNNHTLNGAPFVDICDYLKGKYPKSFKFTSWHPQCRCFAIPILMEPSEYDTDELNELKAAINGTEYKQFQASNTITDVPEGFKSWITDNAKRSTLWKSQPFFIRDNFNGGTIAGGLKLNVSTTSIKSHQIPKAQEPKIAHTQNRIPDEFKQGSNYMNGEKFTFNNDFFNLIDQNKPVTLRFTNDNNSYHRAGLVQIGAGQRVKNSSFFKECVVYHEYGHAIDFQRGLRYSQEVKDLMDKHRKTLKKKVYYTRFVRSYDYESRIYKDVKSTSEVSKIGEISSRLDNFGVKVSKMQEDVFKRRGITKKDVVESIAATQDAIMSLNPNYGWGHTKAYYKHAGAKEAEFLAHAFENAFAGNKVFKKYLPELYDDMVAYIRTLK